LSIDEIVPDGLATVVGAVSSASDDRRWWDAVSVDDRAILVLV
jgi:hypothetical protein